LNSGIGVQGIGFERFRLILLSSIGYSVIRDHRPTV
jgi:hypothetical protein